MQTLVVLCFLAQRLAHAHPDRTLHLAFDRQRVDGAAAIVRYPDLDHLHRTGVFIHFDFDDLCRVRIAGARSHSGTTELAALRFTRC